MRIGIVLSNTPGYSETFFTKKIRGLNASGHHVMLFVSGGKRKNFLGARVICGLDVSGGTLHKILISLWFVFRVIVCAPTISIKFLEIEIQSGSSWKDSFRKLIINSHILPFRLDWLHFGFATMGVDREIVGKAIGAKVAVSFRGYDVSVYPLKHPGCYKKLWQYIDRVHTISDDLLQEAYFYKLPQRVPVTKITPAIDAPCFLIKRAGFFNEGQISILTVARLHWKKGLEYTMEALALLKKEGINFSYTIAGEGNDKERLIFAAYQLGLNDNITFAEKVDHADMPGLMWKNDVYIQYSIQEGFCNSVLEAQAAGMLCIVSDAEGLSENVLDEITGWVVPKRNPSQLASKIKEVITYPQERLLYVSKSASKRVADEFNLEKQRREFVKFYSE